MSERSPSRLGAIALWAGGFAVSVTLVHLGVRTFSGAQGLSIAATVGIAVGVLPQLVVGALLGAAVLPRNGSRTRYLLGWTLVTLVLAVTLAAFHYEAMFGRFPGMSFPEFFTDAHRAGGPFLHRLPEAAVGLETTVVLSALAALSRMVHDIEQMMKDAAETEASEPGEETAEAEGAAEGEGAGEAETADESSAEGAEGTEGTEGTEDPGDAEEEEEPPRLPGNPRVAAVVLTLSLAATIALHAVPGLTRLPALASGTLPLFAFVSSLVRADPHVDGLNETDTVFYRVVTDTNPAPMVDEHLPICAPAPRREEAAYTGRENRNLIVLVLDSLGATELESEADAQPLFPSLRRIASEGAHFPVVYAGGRAEALPALLAGIPGPLAVDLLDTVPPPAVEGWLARLHEHGYQTPGFYGGDDAGIRRFLAAAGVRTLALGDEGAHLSDAAALREIPGWVATLRETDPRAPYAAVFVSTPPETAYDSERLDAAIGELYDWFRHEHGLDQEEPSGEKKKKKHDELSPEEAAQEADAAERRARRFETLFVVVGTHEPSEAEGPRRVPLLIAGLNPRELDRARETSERAGAQHDLGATLMPLVARRVGPCDAGADLMGADSEWPHYRTLEMTAAGGYVLVNEHGEFRYDAATEDAKQVFTPDPDADADAQAEETARMQRLGRVTGPLRRYLVGTDAFAPR